MKKIDFEDRIQLNPRLLRLKNPSTGEIIDYEIQDLLENEIIQDGTEVSGNVLNEMQSNIEESCVVVSPTEPTTNEKVWIQKGENIFNPETDIEFTDRFRECEGGTIASSANHCGVKIKVNPNTSYVTNSDIPVGEWSNLCFFDTDMNFISGNVYNTENKVFTTPNNCAYVTMAVLKTYTYFQLKENIKKIYVKNDNGGYEEFYDNKTQNYSTVEQVIGTWIDGKPIYRKAFIIGTVSQNETVIGNVSNLDRLINKFAPTKWNGLTFTVLDIWAEANGNIGINDERLTEMTDIVIIIEYTKTTD